MSFLIAISAPVGGGKTSLTRGLTRRLDQSTAIHFDHYESLTKRPPADIQRWMRGGADIDELVVDHLAEHLAMLKDGRSVTDPTGMAVEPAKYVLFETPFARQHRHTGSLIDLAIWIDTPLDVALARNLRDFSHRSEMRHRLADWLGPYLDSYLGFVRDLLLMQQEIVGGNADLVLDGLAPLDVNIDRARQEIMARLS